MTSETSFAATGIALTRAASAANLAAATVIADAMNAAGITARAEGTADGSAQVMAGAAPGGLLDANRAVLLASFARGLSDAISGGLS